MEELQAAINNLEEELNDKRDEIDRLERKVKGLESDLRYARGCIDDIAHAVDVAQRAA